MSTHLLPFGLKNTFTSASWQLIMILQHNETQEEGEKEFLVCFTVLSNFKKS